MSATRRLLGARRVAASVVFFGAVAVSVDGCTLALDSPTMLSPNCRFDGSDSACGKCVQAACAAELGACCGDASCQDTLDALDGCAGKNSQTACATLRQNATLGSCVTRSCKNACLGEGGGSCVVSGQSCFCDELAPSDPSKCSEASVGGGSCCADLGWPGSGLSCDCQAFRCKETADGCACGGSDGPNTTCSGAHCCVSSGDCHCSNAACESYETPVAECTSALVACPTRARVASCSQSVN